MQVLGEVKAAYGSDPDIAGIVSAGEAICRSFADTQQVPVSSASQDVMPEATITPAP
ncbi:MAG: hypothetical protein Kow002_12690 [Anaerolineales bacterium]